MRKYLLGILGFAMMTTAAGVAARAGDITDWLSAKGDLRTRFEYIDQDDKDSRERFRIRARLALKATVNEDIDMHVRLATGVDDPVSGNQTMGDGFSTKDFGLDRAYIDFHPVSIEGLNIYAGKMAKPWIVVKDLVWDGDLNPEGVAINYAAGNETVALDLHGGAFFADERKTDDDTYLFTAQVAATIEPADDLSIQGGASLFTYLNMEDYATLYDSEDSFGNDSRAVMEDGEETGELLYDLDFTEVEFFVIAKLDLGLPVKLYSDYVLNTEADSDDTGYMAGVTLGKAKDPGSWQFDYNYRDLEANAVVGVFTDSDSGGGGTDVTGHRVQGKYQIAKNLQGAVTWFMNEIGDDDTDYNRLQVDLIAKF